MNHITAADFDRVKREAAALQAATGIKRWQARDRIALREGYRAWPALMSSVQRPQRAAAHT
jgi:hypothetical protein